MRWIRYQHTHAVYQRKCWLTSEVACLYSQNTYKEQLQVQNLFNYITALSPQKCLH